MIKNARSLTLFATMLCLAGCSVDEFRNVQRKDCDECKRLNGECITDRFCLLRARPADAGADGAVLDAALKDAADDTDATTGDAASGDAALPCVDEDRLRSCYTPKDKSTSRQLPCRPGTHTCRDGSFGPCEGEVVPQQESCNGRDDDCDGTTDEIPGSAECEVADLKGECAIGVLICHDGEQRCIRHNAPQSDVCNGKDDDCDGETDEGTAISCYPSDAIGCEQSEAGTWNCTGTCRAGAIACTNGKYEETCGGDLVVAAASDSCSEPGAASGDEDCDGAVDEGCGCTNGNSCYTGSPAASQTRGPCHAGTWSCSDQEDHGVCDGEVKPEPETCANEGVDNDCDGVVDNIAMLDMSCIEQSTGKGQCKVDARWRCRDGMLACVDAQPAAERCDGQRIDEDCDGMSDENFDVATDVENCGACGVVCASGLRCCDGRCVNTSSSNSNCSICGNHCAAGETCCTGGCVNTLSDPNNCGTCGRVCSGVLKSCTDGACTKLIL